VANLLSLISRARRGSGTEIQRSSFPTLSFDQYLELFQYNGQSTPFLAGGSLAQAAQETPNSFRSAVEYAYQSNGVVFACMLSRLLLFSEARFQFRPFVDGRPGDLFGTPALGPLEKPWPNGTTGDLLARMITDADMEGNFFGARSNIAPGVVEIQRMPPDWVTIVMGSRIKSDHPGWERDARAIGYLYHPGGRGSGVKPEVLLPEEVCHYAPIPDPLSRFRGMSWLTPVLREIMGDTAAMTHKLKFFENGATPNLVVSMEEAKPETFAEWVDVMEDAHAGLLNAYKTIYLGGGSTANVIGTNLQQIDFKVTQGHGETRIAAAAGVPPIIVGLSEGLEAATYSNYGQARRRFADGTMRPLWRNAAASLQRIIDMPEGANNGIVQLWYDDRDIPFLQEDVKERTEILQTEATTVRTLIEAGFQPDDVVKAVAAGDVARLVGKHTGLFSVQLQKAGAKDVPVPEGDGAQVPTTPAPKPGRDTCYVCERGGPGMTALPSGLVLHRWPCQEVYLARAFNPNQPRDPDGKWGHGTSISDTLDHVQESGLNDWPKKGPKAQSVLGDFADTLQMFTNSQGQYVGKRHKVHDKIVGGALGDAVSGVLGDGDPVTKKLRGGGKLTDDEKDRVRTAAAAARGGEPPKALFMAGGPASGKTSVLKAHPDLTPAAAVQVNPDDVKEQLPEYRTLVRAKDKYAAMAAHEESSDIAKRMQSEAEDLGLNMVIDGTGDSKEGKFVKKLRQANDAGYDVSVAYVTVPTDTAVTRAVKRAFKSGRWVPEPEIRKQHRNISKNWKDVKDLKFLRDIQVYDNNDGAADPLSIAPVQSTPTLIASGKGGDVHVHDDDLYASFVMKGNERSGDLPPSVERAEGDVPVDQWIVERPFDSSDYLDRPDPEYAEDDDQ
jgi:phage portal protein BeeE/predicted ABC-type ATPase